MRGGLCLAPAPAPAPTLTPTTLARAVQAQPDPARQHGSSAGGLQAADSRQPSPPAPPAPLPSHRLGGGSAAGGRCPCSLRPRFPGRAARREGGGGPGSGCSESGRRGASPPTARPGWRGAAALARALLRGRRAADSAAAPPRLGPSVHRAPSRAASGSRTQRRLRRARAA